jgi:hypothetical protein
VQLRGKHSQSERPNSSNSVPICVLIFCLLERRRELLWKTERYSRVAATVLGFLLRFHVYGLVGLLEPISWNIAQPRRAHTHQNEGVFSFETFTENTLVTSQVSWNQSWKKKKSAFSPCVQLYAKKAWSNLGRVGSSWFYVFCETLWESLSRTSNVYTVETRALDLYILASCSSSSSSPAGPGLARRGLIFMF